MKLYIKLITMIRENKEYYSFAFDHSLCGKGDIQTNKPKGFSQRADIVNKALLRSLKRFYFQEFKKDNKRIVKKRFRQVQAEEIFNGFKKT